MEFWNNAGVNGKSRLKPRSLMKMYVDVASAAKRAEDLGLDVFRGSEHHFMYNGFNSYALLPVAAAASRTKRIKLMTGCLLLPLHDPLRVAQDIAVADVVSGGRLLASFGVGYRPMEFTGMGTAKKTRSNRCVEMMKLIHLALNEECFSFEGRYYRYSNVRLRPRPMQRPFPKPWWFGGTSIFGARRASANGFHYSVAIVPQWKARQCIEEYRRVAKESGHDVRDLRTAVVKQMCIGNTLAEAEAARDAMLEDFEEHILAYGYLVDDEGEQVFNPSKDNQQYRNMFEGVFCGTPEMAIEHLEEYRQMGVDAISGIGTALTRGNELLLNKVLPHFRGN